MGIKIPDIIGTMSESGLKKARLRYVGDADLEIRRQPAGRGFRYFNGSGNAVSDPEVLNRIKRLVIPPGWKNVLISKHANGHIQAVGRDAKGRKQYIYHPEWIRLQQQNKYDRMIFFGQLLPKIRRRISRDMEIAGLKRERILATVVWLLDTTFIRIGNPEYAKINESYGLTTLRTEHVEVRKDTVMFEFKGKKGIEHSVEVEHPRVARIIRRCIELPGYQLFQYVDEEKEHHAIDSGDVNDYLRRITGNDITAKDFRTWGGTVLAVSLLYEIGLASSETAAKKHTVQAIKQVSKHLGNTSQICRRYYVHPAILESYMRGTLIDHFDQVVSDKKKRPPELSLEEYVTLNLLKKYASKTLLNII